MPKDASGQYESVDTIPDAVRHALDGNPHAMRLWRDAYNAASKDPKYRQLTTPYQVAWAAVSREYEKGPDGSWHRKPGVKIPHNGVHVSGSKKGLPIIRFDP